MAIISVVVRFRNEAAVLETSLRAVRAQRLEHPVELVCADNRSTDGSRQIAQRWADKIVDVDDYRPGAALNQVIAASQGEVLVALSAHAIPASDQWLRRLVAHLTNPRVLAVYGAQHYPATSRFLDKRDLDIFSDPDARSEHADSDFWNANSAFRRSTWLEHAFDEQVIELEDHYWTKGLLGRPGQRQFVRFEPTAAVYHYGHELRNDRNFLEPGSATAAERISAAMDVLAGDSDWPSVMRAGMALGSLADVCEIDHAVPLLVRHLAEHPDFDVRWRMAGALGRTGGQGAVPALVCGLRDTSFYVRDECAWSLARLGAEATRDVVAALRSLDERHRPFAALALGVSADPAGRPAAITALGDLLVSRSADVQRDAVYFLGEAGCLNRRRDLLAPVVDQARSQDPRIARAAIWCLGALSETKLDAAARDLLVRTLAGHPADLVRAEAATALYRSGGDTTRLAEGLYDGAGVVRHRTLEALRLAEATDALLSVSQSECDFGAEYEYESALADSTIKSGQRG